MKRVARTILSMMLLAVAAAGRPGAAARQSDRLSLDEARQYMLGLINHDRASKGLRPLQLDPIATAAGQKHAEEMATQLYLAHWDREGKMPDQRYCEAGGTDFDRENVYLTVHYQGEKPDGVLDVDPHPTFSAEELEDIEAAYFNEVPPDDGHRRNILDSHHTHVGIALAVGRDGDRARSLANTQEFVDRWVNVDPLPRQVRVGTPVTVSGHVLPGASFRAIQLGRTDLPRAMSVEELGRTTHYHGPQAFVQYMPEPYVSPKPVRVGRDGSFSITIPLSDEGRPGVYYVMVWVRSETGRDFVASQRTVLVN